jgi:hypothetical protein
LFALCAGHHIESDALVFTQRFEALRLDRGEVRKNIITAVLGNKSEAFGVIEPLYDTCSHFVFPGKLILASAIQVAEISISSVTVSLLQIKKASGHDDDENKRRRNFFMNTQT